MNQREKIFISIYDIIINNIFLNEVLSIYVYTNDCDNKAYIKRSISGILENKILLDYIIDKYSKIKSVKLDKKVYIILLCAIYELIFMDNSKSYAVINEYVSLTKKYKTQFHANYVNAILRNISRNESKDKINNAKDIDFITKYSIPKDLYEYLKININIDDTNIDKTIERIFEYYQNNNHISFRINTYDKKLFDTIISEFNDKNIDYYIYDKSLKLERIKCIIANNINDLSSIDSFNNGLISVQDVSSIYYIDKLYKLLKDKFPKNIKVLDSCAAPGGKSLAFLEAFENYNIDLYSCDKTENKLLKIRQNFDATKNYIKSNSLNIIENDATIINNSFVDNFNLVLLDLPCSGLGIISKKPDIKYNFDKNSIDGLLDVQNNILNINKNYVKADGYLCYSTCTITKNENDDMVSKFLQQNTNFELLYKEQIISSADNLSDGFYFSIMKRLS